MPRRTAQQSADRWLRSMQGAGQNYTEGIQSVQTHPGVQAAKNVNGYQNGVARAVANGKWQRNVQRGSLQDWQNAAVQKGAARLAQGAQAALPKVVAAQEMVGQMVDRANAAIANMPRDTTAARIARSQVFLQHMAKQGETSGR